MGMFEEFYKTLLKTFVQFFIFRWFTGVDLDNICMDDVLFVDELFSEVPKRRMSTLKKRVVVVV